MIMETEEQTEAKRLIKEFNSYAVKVALEIKNVVPLQDNYFWECLANEIQRIDAGKYRKHYE